MEVRRLGGVLILFALTTFGCDGSDVEALPPPIVVEPGRGLPADEKVVKTDVEWQAELDYKAFQTLRRGVTEYHHSGPLRREFSPGRYVCAGCGLELFDSSHKYDSKTGWPSWWRPASEHHVYLMPDPATDRQEVRCARCDGHLGHRFSDGPEPTGLRYCINSSALRFEPRPATTRPSPEETEGGSSEESGAGGASRTNVSRPG